jgi:hypothetical protein
MTKPLHKIFKVFLFPYTTAMRKNAAKISYTNFQMTSVFTKTRLLNLISSQLLNMHTSVK